jgi:hypothetical protein
MVRKARVWIDGELAWSAEEEEEGGVAVQTQTAVLLTLCAGESLPVEEDAEPDPAPPAASPQTPDKPKRHLAGANWLDDWTLFLPHRTKKPKRQPPPVQD